ncbi:glucokinase [Nitrococcus mobilis]|uniref:Glucokinase n=1 Tax=Nitrococcus mobilis Nb-231 TaxID=314278 RepID=A4BU43_9GAMM|nr:glucokinase [Nitrococcus mobilis]EAR20717.1 glucokinase [Nitrococcus mobilis Nb-231]
MILAGDIGGTSTRLAFFELQGERLAIVAGKTYRSRNYDSLAQVVRQFEKDYGCTGIRHAAFGVAGPVRDRQAKTTNLPWLIDSAKLARELDLQSKNVDLINDLEANAWGAMALAPADLTVLNQGNPNITGNAAVIAVGTGLGEAGLYWDGQRHRAFASEGGHVDFAPRDELEIDLLHYLLQRYRRVSYERVLSGPGLHTIYRFLRNTGRGDESQQLAEAMRAKDPAAVISQAALKGEDALCVQALDLFVAIYGAAAGNLALKLMASAGVYLGGGIAPRIIEKLKGPEFMAAFTGKGRMKDLLQEIPVRVIMNDQTALLGAARCAALKAGLL